MLQARWLLLALILTAVGAEAQSDRAPHPETAAIANLRLWPGTAPGSENVQGPEAYNLGKNGGRFFWNISHPMMTAFYAARPSGAAVLVIPGGGYKALYFDFAVTFARWFNTVGVDAFVLKHRLPDEGHIDAYGVPLQDAQRALRLIRSGRFSGGRPLDPARIGVFGLSAGGHLAAVLSTYATAKVYAPVDAADGGSARPDFMILAYAVLPRPDEPVENDRRTGMTRLYRTYPVGLRASELPPTFVMHGRRDDDVPFAESLDFARRLERAGVPVELHLFEGARHAFGVDAKGEAAQWPGLCEKWLRTRGIIAAGN